MPNQPKTPMLSVRCDRELRDEARMKAQAQGTTLTEIIVSHLRRYVVGDAGPYPDHPDHPDKAGRRAGGTLRQGHLYEHGPSSRCAVKDCGRRKIDH